ncbi:hypothetical protein MHYP_G00089450 [Metynnis hypsauchen]
MKKAREEGKPERDGGETRGRTAKPGKGAERTGATEKNQKPKKRGKEEETGREYGAVVGMKRPKREKTGADEDGQTAEGKVVKNSREEGMRDDKAQRPTASKYQILEAMLESSISTLIEDTKAMLTEVESMQAGTDLKTCRAEQENEKDEVKECSSAPSSLDHDSVTETKDKPDSKGEDREEESSSDSDKCVVWVQCSRADCGKWRKLSEDVDPSVLPDDWICENNPDPAFPSCSVPEEQSSSCEEEIFFCSLVPGSLVWAWQSGHPWWPAMIERDPDTCDFLEFHRKTDLAPYKCHVTYFGDPVCIDWVFCSDVRSYADLSEDEVYSMLEQPELKKKLKDAICMSKQALKLSPQMRLMEFGFWSRYESDGVSSEEDSAVEDDLELFSGKSGKYSDDENLWPKKRCLKKGEEKQRRRGKSGSKKKTIEMNGEKKGKKSERESGKSAKRMQNGKIRAESARNSDEGGLKVNKQKAVADGLVVKAAMKKKCFTPSFSLAKKSKPAHEAGAEEQRVQDQTVPQGAMETTPDIRLPKRDMKTKVKAKQQDEEGKKEKINKKENNKEKQSRWKEKRWEEDLSDEEDNDDEGFLNTDMEILGRRRKELKRLSCREEEEEEEEEGQTDFCLMLLEE